MRRACRDTSARPIATAVPRGGAPARPLRASPSADDDCCTPAATRMCGLHGCQMTSPKDASQVQFRKASRDFGERCRRPEASHWLCATRTLPHLFLVWASLTARAAYRSVDGIRIASRRFQGSRHEISPTAAVDDRLSRSSSAGSSMSTRGCATISHGSCRVATASRPGTIDWSISGGALVGAMRYQSIENGPLMIFAVVGAVLFLFMIRT